LNLDGNGASLALAFIALFFFLIAGYALYLRVRQTRRRMRNIAAFSALIKAIGLSVESGTRLHVSLGSSDLSGGQGAAGLAGLNVLERAARAASISDLPPVVSSGDGSLAVLSQDILSAAYKELESSYLYDPTLGRLTGPTPFSYAAGSIPLILDEQVSTTILAGRFGPEAALITEAAERTGGFTLAGSDSVSIQAMLYAASQEPLIGEELFAAGAYLRSGIFHDASLWAQDVMRWAIALAILGLSILNLLIG